MLCRILEAATRVLRCWATFTSFYHTDSWEDLPSHLGLPEHLLSCLMDCVKALEGRCICGERRWCRPKACMLPTTGCKAEAASSPGIPLTKCRREGEGSPQMEERQHNQDHIRCRIRVRSRRCRSCWYCREAGGYEGHIKLDKTTADQVSHSTLRQRARNWEKCWIQWLFRSWTIIWKIENNSWSVNWNKVLDPKLHVKDPVWSMMEHLTNYYTNWGE